MKVDDLKKDWRWARPAQPNSVPLADTIWRFVN